VTVHTSVIVPTYNRCAEISWTIDAILSDNAVDELIIVIDGCRDGTLELLERRSRVDARIKPLFIENRGEDGARQVGVEQAVGDLVVVIDDDVLMGPGTVTAHVRHHAAHDGSVLLGYMPVRLPQRRSSGDLYSFYYQRAYEAHVAQWEREPRTILQHFWGGHFSMLRADALKVGIVNEGVKIRYHSDYAFGLRCQAAGLTGHFDRRLSSEHLFRRDLDAFVRDAYIQGVDRERLESLKASRGDAGDGLLEGHSVAQRALICVSGSERVANLALAVLRWAVIAMGYCHVYRVQEELARRLQRLQQLRGVRAGHRQGGDVGPRLR
jgi:glycosyltransferase involved in cell wall biosynthesis